MRVLFFGNHTVGVTVLDALRETADLAGVVAHPPDPEDGVRYESVHAYAEALGILMLRARPTGDAVEAFVRDLEPDLIWVTDYRYLLPEGIYTLAPRGAVNLHPSLLPRYRGRASINWAILEGETELGLTAHFIAEGVDSGDIIDQKSVSLSRNEDVGDALNKLMPIYDSITRRVIERFRRGSVMGTAQSEEHATIYPARTPEDGRIDWTRSANDLENLVRAVASPYPGAFTEIPGGRLYVWRAQAMAATPLHANRYPGEVLEWTSDGVLMVRCGEGILRILVATTVPDGIDIPATLGRRE